jgi:hypothetical protein
MNTNGFYQTRTHELIDEVMKNWSSELNTLGMDRKEEALSSSKVLFTILTAQKRLKASILVEMNNKMEEGRMRKCFALTKKFYPLTRTLENCIPIKMTLKQKPFKVNPHKTWNNLCF